MASPLKGRPGGGGQRWRRMLLAGVGALLLSAAPAAADEQPAILKAYGLDWIERVKEEAWPQPKLERPVICLLDTGVAVTDDTPADNPYGPIVARLSVEDPTGAEQPATPEAAEVAAKRGLPQGDSWLHLHGTRMAAIIAAPRNGSGTVGIFPQARIVSVRVTVGTATHIVPADIPKGVRLCRLWAAQKNASIGSVVMAESQYVQRSADVAQWEDAAKIAALSQGILVAAMGNAADASVVAPLASQSVLTVGAGSDDGSLCPNVPVADGQLVGPGCSGLRPAWYEGSSSATAAVGALVAATATRSRPETVAELRATIATFTAETSEKKQRVDGERAKPMFDGLITERPKTAPIPPELQVTSESSAESSEGPELRLWRPGVAVSWKRGTLTVRRTSNRRKGRLRVQISGKGTPSIVNGMRGSVRAGKRPRFVVVWAESADGSTWRSLTMRVKVRR